MKSQPKACEQAQNIPEVMIFSTDENPDGVIIKTSAEIPDCSHGRQEDTGFCLICRLCVPKKTILEQTDQEICKELAECLDREESETENRSTGGTDTGAEAEEDESAGDTGSDSYEEDGSETEDKTVNSDDEDDLWKMEILGPLEIVAFWKRTDKRLANYFASSICHRIVLGFGAGDQSFDYPADAQLTNKGTLTFLAEWDDGENVSEIPEDYANDIFYMVLHYPELRRNRLEGYIRWELEEAGWEVDMLLFDWDDLWTTLVLKWNIANIPDK